MAGAELNGSVNKRSGHHWEPLYLGVFVMHLGIVNTAQTVASSAMNLVTITMDAFGTGLGYLPRKIHTGKQQKRYKMEPGS